MCPEGGVKILEPTPSHASTAACVCVCELLSSGGFHIKSEHLYLPLADLLSAINSVQLAHINYLSLFLSEWTTEASSFIPLLHHSFPFSKKLFFPQFYTLFYI